MTASTTQRVDRGTIAREWWAQTCEPVRGDAEIRARLRRCRSALEVLTVPAALQLARRLGAVREPIDERRLISVLGLVRVLAFVAADGPEPAIRTVGWPVFPVESPRGDADRTQGPRLSEARFRRILQAVGGEEQVQAFVRLVKLVGGPLDVAGLSRDFLSWSTERTRHRWAFHYYAAGSAAPNEARDEPGSDQ